MKRIYTAVFIAALFSVAASASCIGNCGTDVADGVVTLPPDGATSYNYVSTSGGVTGAGEIPANGGTDGSLLTSATFSGAVGDDLEFDFDYVTSDGSGFPDYAWAALEDSSGNVLDYLFTAATTPTGNTSPGIGLPANAATLTPATSAIEANETTWSPLGGSSGACYDTGCGQTGWIQSDYAISAGDVTASGGTFQIAFGVTNLKDALYDSGLAFAGLEDTTSGTPIGTSTPEPATTGLIGLGLLAVGFFVRRQRLQQ